MTVVGAFSVASAINSEAVLSASLEIPKPREASFELIALEVTTFANPAASCTEAKRSDRERATALIGPGAIRKDDTVRAPTTCMVTPVEGAKPLIFSEARAETPSCFTLPEFAGAPPTLVVLEVLDDRAIPEKPTPPLPTLTLTRFDWDGPNWVGLKIVSANDAPITFTPIGSAEVDIEHADDVTIHEPITVEPVVKVTLPVATVGLNVAVSVTWAPCVTEVLGPTRRTIEVGAGAMR